MEDLLRQAVALHQQGQFERAQAIYQQILQLEPANPNALNLLGVIHHQLGRHAEGEELIRRAIKLAPSIPGFHANLGNTLLAQRRMDQAEASYRRAVELQPDYAEGHNNLGVALLGQGKAEESMAQFVAALKLKHNYPSARNNFGNALRARSQYKSAEALYRDALAQDPNHVEAHSNLAITLLAMGRYDEAISEARAVLERSPDHVGAHMTLGTALEDLGRKDEAVAQYREALKRRPEARGLQFLLSAITGEKTFDAAPPEFVTTLFDNYADKFDRHLVKTLKYRAPRLVVDAIKAAGATAGSAVDLGCGTGLCGPLLRPMAKHLTGVDLSSRMIAHARERRVYDGLFVDEIVAFLRVRFGSFDTAVAADVFNYFGDLRNLLDAASQALAPDGLLAFTLEKHEGEGYVLNRTRRYAHSLTYLRSLLPQTRLEEVKATEVTLRIENHQDVSGWLIVLKRTAG